MCFQLQECNLLNYREWEAKWPLGQSIWSGSNHSKADGVAILIKNPLVVVRGSTVVRGGWAGLAHLTYMVQDLNLLNIYGFNDKNDRCDLLEEVPYALVVGGDFRVDNTLVLLQEICKDFKLQDFF